MTREHWNTDEHGIRTFDLPEPDWGRYHKNQAQGGAFGGADCVRCGKAAPKAKTWASFTNGCTTTLVHPDDVEKAADIHQGCFMGAYPIGADCFRKLPRAVREVLDRVRR